MLEWKTWTLKIKSANEMLYLTNDVCCVVGLTLSLHTEDAFTLYEKNLRNFGFVLHRNFQRHVIAFTHFKDQYLSTLTYYPVTWEFQPVSLHALVNTVLWLSFPIFRAATDFHLFHYSKEIYLWRQKSKTWQRAVENWCQSKQSTHIYRNKEGGF